MTDTRLRELERRWRQTGAASDEAALLLERVRTGDLGDDQLCCAALLGHDGARVALGEPASPPPTDLEAIVRLVIDLGPVARLIAAVAVARAEVARLSTPYRARALRAAEEMLACPCAEHRRAAGRVGAEGHELFAVHGETWDDAAKATWHALGTPWFVAEVAADDVRHHSWDSGSSWRDSSTWRNRLSDYLDRALVAANAAWSVAELFQIVSSALVPWVLTPRPQWTQELPGSG